QVGLLEIQNSEGKIVFTTTLTESLETISLDGLSSGVYFWKLQVNDACGTGTLVKP
ncbi:MAG: T9SS type A sorting domain-containing protein, partial [Crocinitomicaceae bacterium]|nr:T9SS type A sorting domain-containing protein [Crocinitomicaceae bacterium]